VSPQQAAHLRLLEMLPKRTHESKARDPRIGWGQKRTPEQEEQLRRDLLDLQAQGKTRREMAQICNTTNRVIKNLIGKSK
jgi:hypothetical protein